MAWSDTLAKAIETYGDIETTENQRELEEWKYKQQFKAEMFSDLDSLNQRDQSGPNTTGPVAAGFGMGGITPFNLALAGIAVYLLYKAA